MNINSFIPLSRKEAEKRGYDECDVVLITGDAYVDHPSFGIAIIGRYLESLGLQVGIISQPDCSSQKDFMEFGRPRLFFGITAGNLDSMVSLYTAQRKIRSDDPYSEGGIPKNRYYLPCIQYTNIVRSIYKNIPVIIGGIEASMRRISHYDFYKDIIRKSILLDSKADILVYGNAEKSLSEIVARLKNDESIHSIKNIRGTVVVDKEPFSFPFIELPDHESIKDHHQKIVEATNLLYLHSNPHNALTLIQRADTRIIRINPPQFPLSTNEIDSIYELPFLRKPHPLYKNDIPAYTMIKNSITSHRGCYGGCSFCALTIHQGKIIQNRSKSSILREIESMRHDQKKNIVITDVGGPTANMYKTGCSRPDILKKCRKKSCLYPVPCKYLEKNSRQYLDLLATIKSLQTIKHVFINSGLRFDLNFSTENEMRQLIRNYVQGYISIAPEHVNLEVLSLMRKPDLTGLINCLFLLQKICKEERKQYYIIPYFIIGHPGANEKTEREILTFLKSNNLRVEQIQEFYPTPITISTAYYVSGFDENGKKVLSEKKLKIKKLWKEMIIRG